MKMLREGPGWFINIGACTLDNHCLDGAFLVGKWSLEGENFILKD